MKILFDARCLMQPTTGIQVVARNLLAELSRSDMVDELVVLAGPEVDIGDGASDCECVRTGIGPYDFFRQREVARLINQTEADILLSPTYFIPYGVKKPYIMMVHDLIPRKIWLGRQSIYYRCLLGERMRSALGIWTVSNYSRREILSTNANLDARVQVLPSGYTSAPGSAAPLCKRRELLVFASRFRHKNISFAIRAFEALQAISGKAWKLHVVGNLSHMQDAAFPEGVSLRGRVTDSELTELYRQCWGVLLPSMEEGFSLPLIEGMSHGCVVFYHRHTAMSETAGEAGVGLDLGRPEEWAQAIIATAAGDGEAEAHRDRARKRAAEFSRERFVSAFHGALSRTLEGLPFGTGATRKHHSK